MNPMEALEMRLNEKSEIIVPDQAVIDSQVKSSEVLSLPEFDTRLQKVVAKKNIVDVESLTKITKKRKRRSKEKKDNHKWEAAKKLHDEYEQNHPIKRMLQRDECALQKYSKEFMEAISSRLKQ